LKIQLVFNFTFLPASHDSEGILSSPLLSSPLLSYFFFFVGEPPQSKPLFPVCGRGGKEDSLNATPVVENQKQMRLTAYLAIAPRSKRSR
jgi:hypothetical protein